MTNNLGNSEQEHGNEGHDNKHVKVEVKYMSAPEPYHHNYLPDDRCETVKADAISHFGIDATTGNYQLRYGDMRLNDSLTLKAEGLDAGHERYVLELIPAEPDTDG